jgi:carbon storage regulator
MLVLSRQRDESIIIGDNVVVTVVDIRGDKVRLGIQAPHEIPVHRREVYEAIQRENLQAAQLERKDLQTLGEPPAPRARGNGRDDTHRA